MSIFFKLVYFPAFFLFLSLHFGALFGQIPQVEREALIALYNATGGDQWQDQRNWLGPPGTESQWQGVTVTEGHVTRIDLGPNNLQGPLPAEIGNLGHLRMLSLMGRGHFPWFDNGITSLPEEIGRCTQLVQLDLGYNLLTELPDSIGNLTLLQALDLSYNLLTELPVSIGNLSSLQRLTLGMNRIHFLPGTVGSLRNLTYLQLDSNLLSELPASLKGLESLERLSLTRNLVTTLPVQLTEIHKLKELNLYGNRLQSIPSGFGKLVNLEHLNLAGNRLRDLCEEIGTLTGLKSLHLSGNELRSLPDWIGGLAALESLGLTGNRLNSLPDSIGNLAALKYLELGETGLTSLPETIGALGNLARLGLEGNEITDLPDTIGNLSRLGWLNLTGNHLSRLPDTIGGLIQMARLDVSCNQLQGPIPQSLGKLQVIRHLNLSSNQLTGSIPPSVMQLPDMHTLLVASNQLEGALPVPFGPSLFTFDAANNNFSGTLPSRFGEHWINSLNLSNNRLSGPIPPELLRDRAVWHLNLSGNQFSGPLPGAIAAWVPSSGADLRWNAFDAGDPLVDDLISGVSGQDIALTQTRAPEHIQVRAVGPDTVELKWKPILFQEGEGGYEILRSGVPEGPFALLATTAGKSVSSMTVTGVENDYFVIRTFTEAHENNRNRLLSNPSKPVSLLTCRDPLTMYFPSAPLPGSDFLGVAVMNFGSQARSMQFEGFGETGTSLPLNNNPALLSLQPGTHMAKLTRELLGEEIASAWLEMTGEESEVGALFQMGSHTHVDGAVPFSEVSRRLYFTHILEGDTAFGDTSASTVLNIVNPGSAAARISLGLFQKASDQTAAEVARTERLLLPKAALSESVTEIFGSRSFDQAHVELEVTEGEGVVGFQWIYIGGSKALAGLPALPVEPAVSLFAPQVAVSDQLLTLLKLINTGTAANTVTINLRTDGQFQTRIVPLPAGGVRESSLAELFGPSGDLLVGSLEVSASELGIIGNVVIGSRDGSFASAAPLQRRAFTQAVFSHVARSDELFTGLALVAPGGWKTANVRLRVFSSPGILQGEGSVELGPGKRLSRLIHELVPDLPSPLGGYLMLDSDVPVFAQQFYGDYAGTFISLVPPTIICGFASR